MYRHDNDDRDNDGDDDYDDDGDGDDDDDDDVGSISRDAVRQSSQYGRAGSQCISVLDALSASLSCSRACVNFNL